MTYLPVPTFALIASQDLSFQFVFAVLVFILLNSMTWTAMSETVRSVPQESVSTVVELADPEEDYLPREYQKPGPTPAEMEALCRWSSAERMFQEWQELLYSPRQA